MMNAACHSRRLWDEVVAEQGRRAPVMPPTDEWRSAEAGRNRAEPRVAAMKRCDHVGRDVHGRLPNVTGVATHSHHHGDVHLDEADWAEFAEQTELEGELLLGFVTKTMERVKEMRGPDAPP